MKFTTTMNTRYRTGIGNIPKAWIEYTDKNYEDHGDVYQNSISNYFYAHIRHWDYDSGGSETHDFVFEDGKSFRVVYDYWAEWYHEDDDDNGLKFEFYIEEISIDDANVPEKKIGRDWL
jgi:hypothetical protein